jgi:hypothetical protein
MRKAFRQTRIFPIPKRDSAKRGARCGRLYSCLFKLQQEQQGILDVLSDRGEKLRRLAPSSIRWSAARVRFATGRTTICPFRTTARSFTALTAGCMLRRVDDGTEGSDSEHPRFVIVNVPPCISDRSSAPFAPFRSALRSPSRSHSDFRWTAFTFGTTSPPGRKRLFLYSRRREGRIRSPPSMRWHRKLHESRAQIFMRR